MQTQIEPEGSRIFKQSALDTGRLYPSENTSGTHFCKGVVNLRTTDNKKFHESPLGIEPATFRFIAQCLNQLQYPIPRS
jgi:hypothetical protein